MTKFFALPAPFVDISIINVDRAFTPRLQTHILARNDLNYRKIGQNILVFGQDFDGESVFSGFGVIDGKFCFGPSSPTRRHVVNSSIGQFTYFNISSDRATADHDLFGHCSVFASQHDGFAILSNRLHLHIIALQFLGIRPRINVRGAGAMTCLHHTFTMQNISPQTVVEKVSQVRIDKRAAAVNGRLEIVAKKDFIDCIEPGLYSECLSNGVDEIIENVQTIVSDSNFEHILADLSGGKDSRMVFGAIARCKDWDRRVRFVTKDIPGTRDLPIACGIMDMFGAQFANRVATEKQPFSAEENIRLWRSYFLGSYHRIGASAWSQCGGNISTIKLSGGNGETFRAFWNTSLEKFITGSHSVRDFATHFVLRNKFSDARHFEEVIDELERTLEDLPAESLQEKLEQHYLYFRNRSHFGSKGFSFYNDSLTWFPLMSKWLLKAAYSLPLEERLKGKLVFDVTRRLHPVLPFIDYDGDHQPWSQLGLPYQASVRLSLNEDSTSWKRALGQLAESRRNMQRGKPAMNYKDWPNVLLQAANASYEEASQLSPDAHELVPLSFISRMRHEFSVGSKKGFPFASKIMSLRDALG